MQSSVQAVHSMEKGCKMMMLMTNDAPSKCLFTFLEFVQRDEFNLD